MDGGSGEKRGREELQRLGWRENEGRLNPLLIEAAKN